MALSPASGPGGGGGIPQGGPLTADLAAGGHGITGASAFDASGASPYIQAYASAGSTADLFIGDGNADGCDVEAASGSGLLLALNGAATQFGHFRLANTDRAFQLDARGFLQHVLAAPADSYLAASDFVLWLDDTVGATKLMVKAKDAGGTVRTAAIALA